MEKNTFSLAINTHKKRQYLILTCTRTHLWHVAKAAGPPSHSITAPAPLALLPGTSRQKFTGRGVRAFYGDAAKAEVPGRRGDKFRASQSEVAPNASAHLVDDCSREGRWGFIQWDSITSVWLEWELRARVQRHRLFRHVLCIWLFIFASLKSFFVHFLSTTNVAESAEPRPKLNSAACDKQMFKVLLQEMNLCISIFNGGASRGRRTRGAKRQRQQRIYYCFTIRPFRIYTCMRAMHQACCVCGPGWQAGGRG